VLIDDKNVQFGGMTVKRMKNYKAGVNFGLWISQYGNAGKEHFDNFITEADAERVATWGMDHIRLPVDCFFFESDEAPGMYSEERLQYIDNCLEWCKSLGLNMIIDLHAAPGFTFFNADSSIWDSGAKNDLFENREKQERFIDIWKMFTKRYRSEGRNLAFELMNELVSDSTEPWNELWLRTVDEIRKIDGDRTIIIGGNKNNECNQLKFLAVTDDPGVVYTFHFYEPGMFTHQRSPFIIPLKDYPIPVTYPFYKKDHQAFFDAFDKMGLIPDVYRREVFDRGFIHDDLEPARRFVEETGKELYCGEFGANEFCDPESAERWFEDVVSELDGMGVGHAVWTYSGDFSFLTRGYPREDGNKKIIAMCSRIPGLSK